MSNTSDKGRKVSNVIVRDSNISLMECLAVGASSHLRPVKDDMKMQRNESLFIC